MGLRGLLSKIVIISPIALVGTMTCMFFIEDTRVRREHKERVAQFEQEKKQDEVWQRHYQREYEKEMLDIYGENWKDHEVKGLLAIVAGYPEAVRRRDAAAKKQRAEERLVNLEKRVSNLEDMWQSAPQQ